jgi:chitin synthase
LGQNAQPTGQRNSYLSHSHHSHTGSSTEVDGDGTEYSEEEVEQELGVGQRSLYHSHQNHSQFINQNTGGEKPFGGWGAANSTPNIPPPHNGTPRDGDMFATPKPDTLHYGPAPVGAQVRRRMTKKKIPLTQGHLVLDLPVPSK